MFGTLLEQVKATTSCADIATLPSVLSQFAQRHPLWTILILNLGSPAVWRGLLRGLFHADRFLRAIITCGYGVLDCFDEYHHSRWMKRLQQRSEEVSAEVHIPRGSHGCGGNANGAELSGKHDAPKYQKTVQRSSSTRSSPKKPSSNLNLFS